MSESVRGRVIAAYGRHLRLRASSGETLEARPFGRGLTIVCGDEVAGYRDAHHAEVHITEVLRRRTVLYRSNTRGLAEAVAANLDALLVVLAALPEPDYFVIDRYLSAAEAAGISAVLVVNKCDLAQEAQLTAELAVYRGMGYASLAVSAASGSGIAELRAALPAGACAALVGQSGVGKSSLVQLLVPGAEIAVGTLVRDEEGRHTTTAARLYELEGGAALIDSPGVRDFAPAVSVLDARTLGFRDVAALAPGCRFADCRHMREPGCAVQAAAGSAQLSARRYESYRRLRRLYEELSARSRERPR